MSKQKPKRYDQMNAQELAAATAQFDRENLKPGKPLTAAQRALHRRAAARGARKAKIDKGAETVFVPSERGLLKEADAFAKEHGLKRSQMVAQGLRLVMQQRRARKSA